MFRMLNLKSWTVYAFTEALDALLSLLIVSVNNPGWSWNPIFLKKDCLMPAHLNVSLSMFFWMRWPSVSAQASNKPMISIKENFICFPHRMTNLLTINLQQTSQILLWSWLETVFMVACPSLTFLLVIFLLHVIFLEELCPNFYKFVLQYIYYFLLQSTFLFEWFFL